MNAEFDHCTTHEFICAAKDCGYSKSQMFVTLAGQPHRMPCLPKGWNSVLGRTYCPKHHIVLVVDHSQRIGIAGDPRLTKASEGICT